MTSLAGAALDMQVRLERFTTSPAGIRLAEGMAETHPSRTIFTDHTRQVRYDADTSRVWLMGQIVPLRFGETFAVSAEICELITAAATSLPEFDLHATDMPSQRGFVWLEEPLLLHDDTAGRPIVIKALGWAAAVSTENTSDDRPALVISDEDASSKPFGVAVAIWTDPKDSRDHMYEDLPFEYRTELPPLFILNVQPHRWEERVADLDLTGAQIIRWLYTLWRFSQEKFIDHRMVMPDRPAQKRAIRAGRPTQEVRVIRLRKRDDHHRSDTDPLDDDDILWSHRWLVKGHWRNQYFPSRDGHAPVWISGYVKGPEHLPLLVKDTVFQVDR